MSGCVNLRSLAGRAFKVERDPAYRAEYGPGARTRDPWLDVIRGRFGEISPDGGDRLAVMTDSPSRINKLAALTFTVEHVRSDQEALFTFPADRLAEIARLIRARSRRRLSAEQRAENAERLKAHQFTGRRS